MILPPLTSQYLNLAKNSSLAIAIGYPDIYAIASPTLNQTGRPIEVILILMAVYLTISLSLSTPDDPLQPQHSMGASVMNSPTKFSSNIMGHWLRKNLFSSVWNTLLTLITSAVIISLLSNLLPWVFSQAQWKVVQENFGLFMVGRFPKAESWRLWLGFGIEIAIALVSFLLLTRPIPEKYQGWLKGLPILWVFSFLVFLWLLGGGLGLPEVSQSLWNGLLLTLLMAIAGITLSFPLGVVLALGRRSELPVIRWVEYCLYRGCQRLASYWDSIFCSGSIAADSA